MDDVIINKAAIVDRCLKRIAEESNKNADFKKNYTKQDSIILNLLRACEACIDMSMHIIRKKNLGIPQSAKEAFSLLEEANIITEDLSIKMQHMSGFRNIAVHEYQKLDIAVVESILDKNLVDFETFTNTLLKLAL